MKLCVVGVGGVGGYFGGRLAEAGNEVVFIARGTTLEALRSNGLYVESTLGDFHLPEVEATDDPKAVGEVDAVLLGVKAWQVPETAELIRPMVGDHTVILPMQNGVEAADQLVAVHGPDPVLGGICWIVSAAVAPGRIHHMGVEPRVALGELDHRPSERARCLAAAFSDAGVTVEVSENIQTTIWEKLLFIASISGVAAVARVPVGELRSCPETHDLLRDAMEEIAALARARGVAVAEDVIERTMAYVDSMPAAMTASMQRDIMDGRPSELESLNGAVVRYGREAGLPTPVHRAIYAALAPMEARARGAQSKDLSP